ncbi:MAG: hypothetical protein P1Q69_04840 [Candidatus Thorarchaeota archaeon]|nr:hypothetical protein [Candidatus Thorarchaeota archaeon]
MKRHEGPMTVRTSSMVLILSLFLLCFIPPQSPATPIENTQLAEDSLVHSATHSVSGSNYSYFSASIGAGHGFYSHYQVTQGYAVELVTLDSTNFENMEDGMNYQSVVLCLTE